MKAPIKGAEPIDAPTRDRIKKMVPEWQFNEFEENGEELIIKNLVSLFTYVYLFR